MFANALKSSINESQINGLGYQLMNRGKLQEAIEVLKLNVREFPNSSNVHDSLGEAHMKAGQTDLAIANYKKSLELNPQNTNAADMLKKLEQPSRAVNANGLDAYLGQYDTPMGKLAVTRQGDRETGCSLNRRETQRRNSSPSPRIVSRCPR